MSEAKKQRETELHRAVAGGKAEKVQELLQQGVDVNVRNEYGRRTPLQIAANNGYEQIVKLLLDAKANSEIRTEGLGSPDKTALHLAAQQGHTQSIKMLLAGGAQINALDANRKTPLHWAAALGHRASIDLLVSRGADVNAQDINGWTASNHWHQIAPPIQPVAAASAAPVPVPATPVPAPLAAVIATPIKKKEKKAASVPSGGAAAKPDAEQDEVERGRRPS